MGVYGKNHGARLKDEQEAMLALVQQQRGMNDTDVFSAAAPSIHFLFALQSTIDALKLQIDGFISSIPRNGKSRQTMSKLVEQELTPLDKA